MTRFLVRGATVLFAAASLSAVAVGCWVVAMNGTPAGVWARNLAAWVAGALLAFGAARVNVRTLAIAVVLVVTALMALTLFAPGLQDVHRWIGVGAIRINGAQFVLPAAVVAWVHVAQHGGWRSALLLPACVITAIQPDASQATALAGAVAVGLLALRRWGVWEGAALLAAGILALVAWLRPDPLAPVAEVEGVMRLAVAASPPLAAAAAAALTAAVIVPAAAGRGVVNSAGWALVGYLGLTALAPIVGAFPVPWVGMCVSPIVGAWLGFALWAAGTRRAAA